mmetsp:Transcript_85106/g.170016  ORF Transcript_85106/g.170016 Transcript_85106/m.170016 type:complete len:1288 (-) Transcript_85106:205-4068(-)
MGCGGSKPEEPAVEKPKEEATEEPTAPAKVEEEEGDGPLKKAEIEERIQGMKESATFELGISGFTLRYGVLSQRGYYPEDLFKQNQDRYIVAPNFNNEKSSIMLGVFDGHGTDGHECAEFVRKRSVPVLTSILQDSKYKYDFAKAVKATWVQIDAEMHECDDFSDYGSGSTAIAAIFRGKEMYVSNIGDSRAIIGERSGKRILAQPLSIDQTPYRKDERDRVKAAGAMILTQAMIMEEEEYVEGWDDIRLEGGEDDDGSGDPPRIYDSTTNKWGGIEFRDGPGCAFTRSIGDASASHLGVYAEAEMLHKQIREQDQMIAIASDGVWEFLTNQSVCDTIMQFDDPVEACRQVISQAYGLWLQFEVRTDDITLLVAFIDMFGDEGKAPRPPSEEEVKMYAERKTMAGEDNNGGLSVGGGTGFKPVRRGLSAEKKKELGVAAIDDDDAAHEQGEWKMEVVPKTKAEIQRITAALKGNFLFAHLPPQQAKMIYDVMKRRSVTQGEVVIKQGDQGNHFYILDDGEFRVTIEKNGSQIEILRYKPNPAGANPCFGELALMYSKPRAASVTALTDGALWEIDRRSFREILKKSSTKNLVRTLRSVNLLKSLTASQLQRLSEMLSEVKFNPGEFILKQGEEGDTFYIISEGQCIVTKNEAGSEEGRIVAQLGSGQYFGERALLKEEARAANVIASGDSPVQLLHISKEAFEEVLGPLENIMNEEANFKFKMAFAKQLRKNAAGLTNASLETSFRVVGVTANTPPTTRYMLVKFTSRKGTVANYTLKVRPKKIVFELNMANRLRLEMKLTSNLKFNSRLVPIPLQTLEDDSYIYNVMPTRTSTLLIDYVEHKQGIPEKEAKFFAACLINGLDWLHNEIPVLGGVAYRNLNATTITLDEFGWCQLMDMQFAVQAEPPPRDYVGEAHYYAPEQIKGQGHGIAIDFWALGCTIYELVSMGNPFLTGVAMKDSELAIYHRITSHKPGELQFPADLDISVHLGKLLNALLEPDPEKRLGLKKGAPGSDRVDELRQHPWFSGFDWETLNNNTAHSPAQHWCHNKMVSIEANQQEDKSWNDLVAELFNEVYIPADETKDEFEGITSTGVAALSKGGPVQFTNLMMDAARNRLKQRIFKKMRAERYAKLKESGALRQSTLDLGSRKSQFHKVSLDDDDQDEEDENEEADGTDTGLGNIFKASFRKASKAGEDLIKLLTPKEGQPPLATPKGAPATPKAAPPAAPEATAAPAAPEAPAPPAAAAAPPTPQPPAAPPPATPKSADEKLADVNALMAKASLLMATTA